MKNLWLLVVVAGLVIGLLSGCASVALPPEPTQIPLPDPLVAILFYWEPDCSWCQLMVDDLNRIHDSGDLTYAGIVIVGMQVRGELVTGLSFTNILADLPRAAPGTPYVELVDYRIQPPVKLTSFVGYRPVGGWIPLFIQLAQAAGQQ